jgi:hypothetical protein
MALSLRLWRRRWNVRFDRRSTDGARLAIVLILFGPWQIHQPRLPPPDPEFVARDDIAGSKVESTEHDLRLVIA